MRTALITGLFITALAMALPSDQATAAPSEGRWCAQVPIGDDAVSERCNFNTIEECRREIVGVGGSCVLNPYYRGPQQEPRPGSYDRGRRN